MSGAVVQGHARFGQGHARFGQGHARFGRRHASSAWLLGLLLGLCTSCAVLGQGGKDLGLEIDFRGDRELSRSALSRVIAPALEGFATSRYKKSLVDDAAYELERHYHAQGFPFARVDYRYEEPPEDGPRAVFEIEEGPRTEVAEVRFVGNTAFDVDTLADFFEMPRESFLGPHRTWYVASRVQGDAEELELWYAASGYRDARVAEPTVEFDAARTKAVVTVSIAEGIQYRLARVDLEGDAAAARAELERLWAPFLGQPYFERLALDIQGRIEEHYANRGYPDARVERLARESSPSDERGEVHLAYRVTAGPRVTISAVEIRGAPSTKKSFLRSRIELEPGDLYSREKERESFRKLYQTGLFERVNVGLGAAAGDGRPLEVELAEASSLELFLQPGYGSYERARLTAGAREKNLFGTGRILGGEGTVSELAQSGRVSLTDPWFLGSDVSANLALFGNRRQEPSFRRLEVGSGLDFTRRFTRRFQASVGYQYKRSDLEDVEVVDAEVEEALEDVDISSILFSPTWDNRDNIFDPTRGSLSKLVFEVASEAIGSEIDFFRLRATQSSFFELDGDTALGASVRVGVITPTGGTESIPLQERFFNGGENTVRSYQEDELGPKDSAGEPLGGEASSVLSVELRRKAWGHFQVALFYDIGNVVADAGDFFDFRGYGQAIGLGLRYATPVGPIRLDGALNPDPEPDEASGAIHFTVGMAF